MKAPKRHISHAEEVGTVAGELVGAVLGIAAGPVGIAAGMVIGGVAGDLAGRAIEDEGRRKAAHEQSLDEAIGVTGGDLGAASAGSPAARVGAPSAASSGAATHGGTPAEGPMQDVDD